MPFTEFC